MLTPGNKKLGRSPLIWGFTLPSGDPAVCPGLTPLCREHCYARRIERIRPSVLAKYRKNLAFSRRADFALRVRCFIVAHDVRVVRVHVGGDFYSATYAAKWLKVMRGLPRTRFFFYTRSWRLPGIRPTLEQMARLRNCRVWYSCDRQTGVPDALPRRVRLAWLMTAPDDISPERVHLTFRIHRLRRQPVSSAFGARICPEEDGRARSFKPTCDRCRSCWRPLSVDMPARASLVPLVTLDEELS